MKSIVPVYTAEEIHNEITQAYINYMTIIVTNTSSEETRLSADAESLIKMYKSIGATNTPQYLALTKNKRNIENNKKEQKVYEMAHEYITKIRKYIPSAELIPYSEYSRIMLKYDLYDNLIKHYSNDIPAENLNEISFADKVIEENSLSNLINLSMVFEDFFGGLRSKTFRIITEVSADVNMPEKWVKRLMYSIHRYPYTNSIDSVGNRINLSNKESEKYFEIKSNTLGTMFHIAAPRNHFREEAFAKLKNVDLAAERKRAEVKDPLVGWKSPYGAVCISKWGEVTNENIFNIR